MHVISHHEMSGYLKSKMGIKLMHKDFRELTTVECQLIEDEHAHLERFLRDQKKDKRERLVRTLLSDDQRYAQHWLTFWNDALRNDYVGTGYIDGGRKQISSWLYSALATNLPYDRFVSQLINPTRDSEGFTKGIVWRGAVNASQVPPLQAAQHISQVFMGVNLKCASCHDSFINDWSLADAYGLANIYADEPLEVFHCDKPTGKKAPTKFIYSELGQIDGSLDKAARMRRLAEMISSSKNGRLTRTMVNRLWLQFMGRGLVETIEDMEQPSWNPELLDWLAEDLAGHGFNLRHTMEQILTSRAYQLPTVNLDDQTRKNQLFSGPMVRRLSSEQFRDALGSLVGIWFDRNESEFDFLAGTARQPASMLARNLKPRWIWNGTNALTRAPLETVFWRRTVTLPEKASEAFAVCSADNSFTLYLNGNKIGSGNDWERPRLIDLRPYLLKGENVFAIETANTGEKDKPNPAGLLFYARIRHRDASKTRDEGRIMDFASDAHWHWTNQKSEGWERPGFENSTWSPAVVQDETRLDAKDGRNLAGRFSAILSGTTQHDKVRASMVRSDPLTVSLGRPKREQVVTMRSSTATTLQALELTNGSTLDNLLKRGAEKLIQGKYRNPQSLVEEVYRRALGRKPTAQELELASELIGTPVKKESVEDLLWSMTMLPEFQLIY